MVLLTATYAAHLHNAPCSAANPGGAAHGRGTADWVARPEAQSVVIHAIPPGGSTAGGPKIACADLG
jgi:hypothetical protein